MSQADAAAKIEQADMVSAQGANQAAGGGATPHCATRNRRRDAPSQVAPGQQLPHDAHFQLLDEGADEPRPAGYQELFEGKRVVLFGLPGARRRSSSGRAGRELHARCPAGAGPRPRLPPTHLAARRRRRRLHQRVQ
jgi:hypothetical protein